jgi:hypothetical protein
MIYILPFSHTVLRCDDDKLSACNEAGTTFLRLLLMYVLQTDNSAL